MGAGIVGRHPGAILRLPSFISFYPRPFLPLLYLAIHFSPPRRRPRLFDPWPVYNAKETTPAEVGPPMALRSPMRFFIGTSLNLPRSLVETTFWRVNQPAVLSLSFSLSPFLSRRVYFLSRKRRPSIQRRGIDSHHAPGSQDEKRLASPRR